MQSLLDPFSFLVVSLAGWMNQHQQHVIHYLMEENRVLREQIGNRRIRFTDDQRRRLAAKAKRARPEVAKRSHHDRHAGDDAGLAPKADREEIRWKREPWSGTTTHGGRDNSVSDSNGRGKSQLGVSEDSRSAVESRSFAGLQNHRQHSKEAWHRARPGAESQDDMDRVS